MIKNIMKPGFIFLILLNFSSCTNRNHPTLLNSEVIPVKNFGESSGFKISDILKDIEIVPLESSNECMIGEINRIIVDDDKIFILDWLNSKNIFAFNKEGKFLFKVGGKGKGPGEFISPSDFFIDKKKNVIHVIDNTTVLLSYSLNQNVPKLIKEQNIPDKIAPFQGSMINSNYFAFICGGISPNLCICDLDFNHKNYYFPYISRTFSVLLRPSLYYSNEKLLYQRYMNDTIFQIDDNGAVIPYKIFDFKDEPIDFSQKLTEANINLDEKYMLNYYYEHQNTFYLKFSKGIKSEYLLFKDSRGKYTFSNIASIENDIFGYEALYCIGNASNGKYIFYFEPYRLLKYISKHPNKISNDQVLNLLPSISNESNPVIILANIK